MLVDVAQHDTYTKYWSAWMRENYVLCILNPRKNPFCGLITQHPHSTEPQWRCAELISGSRWRVSKWEAQSGSMYVRSKRMTLAESQLWFDHKKHTLSVHLSPCMPPPHTQTHTLSRKLPSSFTFLYSESQTPPHYHFIERKKEAICQTLTRHRGSGEARTSRWLDTESL